MTASEPASPLHIANGSCYVFFAYEVGLSIDLDRGERRITDLTQREHLRHKRRTPQYFEYRPAPLRIPQDGTGLSAGDLALGDTVDLVVYDFGAVSVTYTLPLAGSLPQLLGLSEQLYDNEHLRTDSRQRVLQLLTALDDAVVRPHLADFVETYAIFQIQSFVEPCPPSELYTTHAQAVAQILRSERAPLSADEIQDATAQHISYSADDVAIIDWDAALVFEREAEDVRAVLEFANVELLEMRYLDQQLDDGLDEAYQRLSKRAWRGRHLLGSSRADLQRVAQLQVDNAILFEGVNNALKLLGDQYLARVYRMASARFHLAEWDGSILRKLQTLESIHQQMSDAAANWRLEVLEWIIILLSALSVAVYFLPALTAH